VHVIVVVPLHEPVDVETSVSVGGSVSVTTTLLAASGPALVTLIA